MAEEIEQKNARCGVGIVATPADRERLRAALTGFTVHPLDRPSARPAVHALVVHAFAEDSEAWLTHGAGWGLPVVLSCAPGADVEPSPTGHSESDCVDRVRSWSADAYVWRVQHIAAALAWVLAEDRAARLSGPLRLTYLGRAGADQTRSTVEPAIGAAFFVGSEPLLIGRWSQPTVAIHFATSVARHHARVRRTATGVTVEDLASANGTWLRGERAPLHTLVPGDELAVAGFLRLRLDGDPREQA